jgi:hypothetical protein
MVMAASAEGRGDHGNHHGSPGHGIHSADGSGSFAGDHRRGNDAYVKSAAEEEDKLLNTKIKSICRGC